MKQKNHTNTELIGRFMPYFRPYLKTMALDLFMASLTILCEMALPLIVRYITDKGMNDIASLTVEVIVKLGLLYLALRLVDAAANYYMASIGHIMGAKIETDMRRDLFAHLQKLPLSYYDDTKVGQIMARITSDLIEITEFAHHCPEEFFIAGLKAAVSFAILASVNLWLTVVIFAGLPLMLVFSTSFNHKMRRAFKRSRDQIGELNAQVEDSLLGIRVVRSFVNEESEKEKFEGGNRLFFSIKKESYRYLAGFHTTIRLFDGLMYITVVVASSLFMIHGDIAPADVTAYLLYVTALLASVRRIVEFTEQFQRGMTGIERFIEVMDAPTEKEDEPDSLELTQVKGDIRFEHVGFRYAEEHEKVLFDINLHVRPGERVAIVGPSGAGKTTLCSLIPRFYEVTEGKILIDGTDIRCVTRDSLRQNIGVVQQDVYLFACSVAENIAYGKPEAGREEIAEAARLAGAHDFIMELPQGYDTYVGERGVKLSGGQKQRISIARAFLKNPPVLILDEATSSLDTESERIVQRSLERLSVGRTTFIIAHRLTTIQNAAVILVLTDQGIEEKGTHEELMTKKGIYYRLYSFAEEENRLDEPI